MMTDKTKPPMIVWLQHGSDDDVPFNELDASEITWADQCCFANDYGPYVHIDQLIEAVADGKYHNEEQNEN